MSSEFTAHLAGADLTVQGQLMRQLCQWCGHVLCDYDLSRMAVHPVDGDSSVGGFEVGAWVEVSEGNPTVYRAIGPTDKYPENSCMARSLAEARPLREVRRDRGDPGGG